MKLKVLATTLLLLYVSGTAGLAISLHFCGKKISNIQVNSSAKKSCCGKVKEDMKCCKDKHIQIKVSDEHASVAQLKVPQTNFLYLLPQSINYIQVRAVPVALLAAEPYRGPPGTETQSLIIKNQVFRI
jgi:hypothetical protein